MKIERKSDNQIMIKMTLDDLEENGLTLEDLSLNAGDKVRKFIEMLVDDTNIFGRDFNNKCL